MIEFGVDAVQVVFNPAGGHLHDVVMRWNGREIRPLHRAPWIDSGEALPDDIPLGLRNLAGDFFCAPFADSDIDGAPGHGWTANGHWDFDGIDQDSGGVTARFTLQEKVFGATVRKAVTLRQGQPIVYQRHVFEGGAGALPMAHHAMVRAPGGAALSFSPKAFGTTPPTPVEPDAARGRSVLAYPQRFAGLDALRLADGRTVDASRYPFADSHEDIVLLAEAPGSPLGWSAALAAREGFLFFGLKDPRRLPFTMLWMSNGGRDYPPFSGRHRHVLGIEEGCMYLHLGHRASMQPNPLTAEGYSTAIALDPAGRVEIAYAFGAVPAEPGWDRVEAISHGPAGLDLRISGGPAVALPFEAERIGLTS
jgi:hypothetical protein